MSHININVFKLTVSITFIYLFAGMTSIQAQPFTQQEITRWQKQAEKVIIIRDIYGIPHIYGDTDADVVFGLMYAQCEDDYKRIEMNYIEKLGRMSEIKGETFIHDDLLIRLLIDSKEAIKDYKAAPKWLKKLCNAFADGMNYYLYRHPNEKSVLLHRYEPWYPFLWTDGSIGAINTAGVTAGELGRFYTNPEPLISSVDTDEVHQNFDEPLTGSNGFAFAPALTQSGNSILYINPHVTMYFRPEVHLVSKQGLNVYGAVTWGQFFVYQGFNEYCGWMHTSSFVDAADLYTEKIEKTKSGYTYLYDGKYKKVAEKEIRIDYSTPDGMKSKYYIGYYTGHGPVFTKRAGKLLSLQSDNRLKEGLVQCWNRTKTKGLSDFKKTLNLKGNISNNTVYADRDGNIAYWHGNRIPKRDTVYDWNEPVDGTIRATSWKGYHSMDEIVHCINPPNGWLQNCNSTPYTCAGKYSPVRKTYPLYMAPDGENFRGINAVRTLTENRNYDLNKVIETGYNTRMAAFEVLIPALIACFENYSLNHTTTEDMQQAIDILSTWDYQCADNSVATTLAVEFGERMLPAIYAVDTGNEYGISDLVDKVNYIASNPKVDQWMKLLEETISDLNKQYGTWKVAWGAINRFQRLSTDIENRFDDSQPSIPVAFTSSLWGTLPSFGSKRYLNTINRYGFGGNSFICAVEFGEKVRAKALLGGGQSGREDSPHFFDQGERYAKGEFRDVLFYKEDVMRHIESIRHPGE